MAEEVKLITMSSHPELAKTLVDSANKQGWDIVVIESNPWRGFSTKLIETFNYLKSNPEIEQFIFCDAHDVIVLGTEEEFKMKMQANGFSDCEMLCSAERGLWPGVLEPKRPLYPKHSHRFDYLNSGLYYVKTKTFNHFLTAWMPEYSDDDQLYLSEWFLHSTKPKIELDNNQAIFNSHSFIDYGEYGYENNRIQILGNEPIFVHFNGRTIDPIFNERIKI